MKIIIISCLLLAFNSTQAVKRWGKITNGISYDRLSITQQKSGSCKLSLEIENNTKKMISNYSFKIFAYDIHDSIVWTTSLRTGAIQSGDEKTISKKIKRCTENNPYRLEFRGKKL